MSATIGKSDIIKLISKDLDKAKTMAINRATNTTVARMKDTITNKYNIKRKDIVSKVNIIKANKNCADSQIIIPHKPLGLIYFNARQVKKGVSYSILKTKRVIRPHGFILNVSKSSDEQQKQQVFERYGDKIKRVVILKSGKSKTVNRQRIRKVTGMAISQMFLGNNGKSMQIVMQSAFNDAVNKELIQASKYLIGKR
jgi:hypothetical protein